MGELIKLAKKFVVSQYFADDTPPDFDAVIEYCNVNITALGSDMPWSIVEPQYYWECADIGEIMSDDLRAAMAFGQECMKLGRSNYGIQSID